MREFKVGDKVVPQDDKVSATWKRVCAKNNILPTGVFTVVGVNSNGILLEEVFGSCGLEWCAENFRLATGLDMRDVTITPITGSLENHLLDLLDAEKAKVAALEESLKITREQLDTQARRNNAQSDLIKEMQLAPGAIDARLESAELAAKALGEEVRALREDRSELRVSVAELAGMLRTIEAAVEGFDMHCMVVQLETTARMCEKAYDMHSARLCFDAARVISTVTHVLLQRDEA